MVVPKSKHLIIEKSIKKFNERQRIQAVIKFAIEPPIVLLGLISRANFFVNFGPTCEATKSPDKTVIKYIKTKYQALFSSK